jgi:hypothetical protein
MKKNREIYFISFKIIIYGIKKSFNPFCNMDDRIYEIYTELSKGGIGGIITGFTSVSSSLL